jgi:hypothetical protein
VGRRVDRGQRRVSDDGVIAMSVACIEGDDDIGPQLADHRADLVRHRRRPGGDE